MDGSVGFDRLIGLPRAFRNWLPRTAEVEYILPYGLLLQHQPDQLTVLFPGTFP